MKNLIKLFTICLCIVCNVFAQESTAVEKSKEDILKELIENSSQSKEVLPIKLGIAVDRVSQEVRDIHSELQYGSGLIIRHVEEPSAASRAGLKVGDILVGFGGQYLVHPVQLEIFLNHAKEGNQVSISLLRDGEKKIKKVRLGKVQKAQINKRYTIKDVIFESSMRYKDKDGKLQEIKIKGSDAIEKSIRELLKSDISDDVMEQILSQIPHKSEGNDEIIINKKVIIDSDGKAKIVEVEEGNKSSEILKKYLNDKGKSKTK